MEWPESNIVWTEPRDLPMEGVAVLMSPTPQQLQSPRRHRQLIFTAFADGHIEALPFHKLSLPTVRALLTRAGGDTVEMPE
jgi:hypothetical protein